jgi:hypothetical protein
MNLSERKIIFFTRLFQIVGFCLFGIPGVIWAVKYTNNHDASFIFLLAFVLMYALAATLILYITSYVWFYIATNILHLNRRDLENAIMEMDSHHGPYGSRMEMYNKIIGWVYD